MFEWIKKRVELPPLDEETRGKLDAISPQKPRNNRELEKRMEALSDLRKFSKQRLPELNRAITFLSVMRFFGEAYHSRWEGYKLERGQWETTREHYRDLNKRLEEHGGIEGLLNRH